MEERMKKSLINLAIATVVLAAIMLPATACSPYNLTDSLGGKNLVYAYGQSSYESYAFNKKGDGGSYQLRYYTYGYPTAAAEGDYARKTWFQTSGDRGTFTYNKGTLEIVYTRDFIFTRIPNRATSYQADYMEFAMVDLYKAWDSSCSYAAETMSNHLLFNQDAATRAYARDESGWACGYRFEANRVFGSDTEHVVNEMASRYDINEEGISYSSTQNWTIERNEAVTRTYHYSTDEAYDMYAAYKVGASSATAQFADIWKKGNTVTFRANRTSQINREWDGDTPPSAPAVDPATGYGTAGSSGTTPRNYYTINNNLYTSTLSFQNYGDFITFWTNAPGRAVE
jgi:hypothetical protein